jgi:hypothetical protein
LLQFCVLLVWFPKCLTNKCANIIDGTLEAVTNNIVLDYGYVTLVVDDEQCLEAHMRIEDRSTLS